MMNTLEIKICSLSDHKCRRR